MQPPAFTNPDAATFDSFEFAGLGMPPSEITLAELLADHGYHTAHIGKWHLGEERGISPHDQGFAESILMASGLCGRRDDENIIQARQEFDPIDCFQWQVLDFAASFNGGPWFEPPKYLTDYYTDEAVKLIEANGLDENTLVIFTSDNGGAGHIGLPDVNAPYRGWKSTLFEGSIRVPFLARWPAKLLTGKTHRAEDIN